MPGPKQIQELIAGSRTALAVEGQTLKRVFPGRAGGSLHQDLVFLLEIAVGIVIELLHHECDFTALDNVVCAELPLAAAQTNASEKGAVGAGKVGERPALVAWAGLGRAPADRGAGR